MRQHHSAISVKTDGKRLYDITPHVLEAVKKSNIQQGLLTLYIQHTSASLLINENYDADVLVDMEAFFARLVPDGDKLFIHTVEGVDDMPAHIRCALTQTCIGVPVINGKLALGQWQGIFVFEHRLMPQTRHVLLHMIGE